MSDSLLTRVFLGANAAFSVVCGLMLTSVPGPASEVLFADAGGWHPAALRAVGVGLMLFAAYLLLLSAGSRLHRRQVLTVSLADLGWVFGSTLLIAGFGDIFRPDGVLIVVTVAALVAVFAIGQLRSARAIAVPLSRVSLSRSAGVLSFRVSREVNAPASLVWNVMTDHPGYADAASNISRVEVVSGDGLGMQRRCYGPKSENWLETCKHFDEGRAFAFRVHTEAPDYPYPIAELSGRWAVEPTAAGSEFSIRIDVTPKGGLFARTLFSLLAGGKFKAVLIDLAEAWAARMERPPQQPTESGERPAPAPV
ncbi:MAG: SRPBCC family protein [Pseudomonadota bacterium]